jgi:ADP-heptose:LPS heptosyltransferase/GT2 family glycosyltransferase
MARVTISLIGMRRPSGTREAVELMLRHGSDCDFILTSNGCRDTAREFQDLAKKHPNITVFENATNEGFQKPHARSFRIAAERGSEFLFVANDDIRVPQSFLETLLQPMADPQVAITGPEGNCCALDHDFHGTGGDLEYIEGSASLIRISAVRKHRTQIWCPHVRFCYGEDSSLSLFLREKGYRIALAPLHVEHARSVTVNGDPETKRLCTESQAENHANNRVRWAHYLKTRRFDFPIILKRKMAIGDVILTTPIIRAIKESNPLSDLYVETDFPEVFENNPLVAEAAPIISQKKDELVIDLNGSYEDTTMQHILDAYEATTRKTLPGLGKVEWRTELHPSKKDIQWAQAMKAKLDSPKLCVLHGDPLHWPGKALSAQLLEHVASHLRKNGWKVALIGKQRRLSSIGNDRDFTGETTLLQTAAILKTADLFIGPDSSPLHLSQSVGCPSIGIFGVTSSRFILTHGSKSVGLDAPSSIPSAGLRHRRTGVTFLNEGKEAMDHHKAEDIFKAITQLGL